MRVFVLLSCLISFLTSVTVAKAQTDDDNIIIENRSEILTYKAAGNDVVLEERSVTDYTCMKWPEAIVVAEFYDIFSEIRKVSVKASNKVTPTYEMYRSEGIFHSDVKVCYFSLPFSKKGEKASVTFEKTYKDIARFNTVMLFEPQFVKRKNVVIEVPGWMQVDIIEHNFGGNVEKNITTDRESGLVRYTYTVEDHYPVKHEPGVPPYYKTEPYIVIVPREASMKKVAKTFFNTYDDVYKWCKEKVDMTSNEPEAVLALTQSIIADCVSESDKVAEIFAWVQNNIRYIAFEYGIAGFAPDNAQDVLRKKYGDCKGMSNLLKVMLQQAGFDARLVWVGTKSIYSNPDIPLPMFNHMICALFLDGQVGYLDPTVKYMVPGEYHEAIQGCATLIEDGDKYIKGSVPFLPPEQNTDRLYCEYAVEDGKLTGNVVMTLSGESKQVILSQIHALESSRRVSALKQFLEKGKPQNKVSDISVEGMDSRHNTLTIRYKEVCGGSVNVAGDDIYVDMDTRQDFMYNNIDTVKRKYDMEFFYREAVVSEESLEIPEGYAVALLPGDLSIDSDNYSIDITYGVEEGRVKYRKKIVIKDIWLKQKDFPKWNSDLFLLKKSYLDQVVLRKI